LISILLEVLEWSKGLIRRLEIKKEKIKFEIKSSENQIIIPSKIVFTITALSMIKKYTTRFYESVVRRLFPV